MDTIEIRGAWMIKSTAHNGNGLELLIELPDGTLRTAIAEAADDGPISHYVHPTGILNAPIHPLTYAEGREVPSRLSDRTIPGWEGAVGPFPGQYGTPHVYARDVHSGAGNCVCGQPLRHRRHVQAAPGVPIPPLPTDEE